MESSRSDPTGATRLRPRAEPPPSLARQGREFAQALVDCVGGLARVHRAAWILRAFHELSTREIAAHPEVGVNPGNVDVILSRCRRRVRECMAAKGFDSGDMPPGSFVAVWSAFRGSAGAMEEELGDG